MTQRWVTVSPLAALGLSDDSDTAPSEWDVFGSFLFHSLSVPRSRDSLTPVRGFGVLKVKALILKDSVYLRQFSVPSFRFLDRPRFEIWLSFLLTVTLNFIICFSESVSPSVKWG